MSKRTLAISLWFMSGWVLGASVAVVSGTSGLLAPALALAAAALVAWDPAGRLWSR